MLSDEAALRQAAHQAYESLQTTLLWKRKMQRIPENAGNTVLSGEVWVDHTYINAPMSVRKGKKRRGLAGTGDSEDAFLGHIAPGSCVYHDMGHFGSRFPGCKETAVNSEDPAAHCLLNPVNRLCAQAKRMFAVHLRIHRKNVPLWLNEKAFQREKMRAWGSADTCRSPTEESSCPGKPSEDGMFSPFSNTFVYPSQRKSVQQSTSVCQCLFLVQITIDLW